jgi:hypothetical protein
MEDSRPAPLHVCEESCLSVCLRVAFALQARAEIEASRGCTVNSTALGLAMERDRRVQAGGSWYSLVVVCRLAARLVWLLCGSQLLLRVCPPLALALVGGRRSSSREPAARADSAEQTTPGQRDEHQHNSNNNTDLYRRAHPGCRPAPPQVRRRLQAAAASLSHCAWRSARLLE